MKLISVKVNNQKLLILFFCLLTGFFILFDFLSYWNSVDTSAITDNVSRIEFIKRLGVIPEDEVFNEKEIVIPKKFSDVYLKYNEIQKAAGYDLTDYIGQSVTVYTYRLPDFRGTTAYVNLMITDGKVIGGDISAAEIDGFMLPLRKIE